jgi:predicted acyl esterase
MCRIPSSVISKEENSRQINVCRGPANCRLDLWATANVFVPGHRIRLEVSRSNFPRLAVTVTRAGRSRAMYVHPFMLIPQVGSGFSSVVATWYIRSRIRWMCS